MDYRKFFSDDVPSFMRSPVREIFARVDLSAICSFAGGYPAASTFPTEAIKQLSARVLDKYGAKALQYGATQGVPELRAAIAERYGVPVSRVQITTSSQQGIDVCSRIFLNPGDIVLAHNPVYLGALQSFAAYRATVVDLAASSLRAEAIECLDNKAPAGARPGPGFCTSKIVEGEKAAGGSGESYSPVWNSACLSQASATPASSSAPVIPSTHPVIPSTHPVIPSEAKESIKFIYVIPDFNNPSGETMTLQEREELVAFARERDLIIVEDSPYRELRYSGETLPTIYSLAPERTLHLGSFSKILAPGFRLGWIIGPEPLLEQIYVCKQALDLCPPVFDQYIAAEYIASGELDRNLVHTIAEYRERRDRMLALLEQYMPAGTSWTRPDGGLFLFLTLPEAIDTVALYDEALDAGVAYVAGSFFYTDGSHRNTMRLNFSFIAQEKMEPGIRLLSKLIRKRL